MRTQTFTNLWLTCLLFFTWLSSLIAQPTVTSFAIQRSGGANYTTSFVAAGNTNDASATALEVPVNTWQIKLQFSEAVIPATGNSSFNTLLEISDLLTLKLGSRASIDLLTTSDLNSTIADLNHSADGKTITFDLRLKTDLLSGSTYTLKTDTNQVVARADGTTKAKSFSAVFSTAKEVSILPATTTTICNSGRAKELPPIVISEQSVGSFTAGKGTLILAFDNADFTITKAPTVSLVGAPGDFLIPTTQLNQGKLELAFDFTDFQEVSGLMLSGMEVTSKASAPASRVQLLPVSGYEHFTGLRATTILATINGENITTVGGPMRPVKISGFTTVCQGGTEFTYTATPVAGVSGYHWKLPTGFTTTDPDAVLVPANGAYYTPDNQININVTGTTSLGNHTLEVKSVNDCHVSVLARNKSITVAPAPNPLVTLPATKFSDESNGPVIITVTNSPAGGTGMLRGDGVINDKLYPNHLLPGKNYKVYYDYTINNCTTTAIATFEVYDPDAVVQGLLSSYCSNDTRFKTVTVEDLASAGALKLYDPANNQIPLSLHKVAPNTYEYTFSSQAFFNTYGAGAYRFEVQQISLPGTTIKVTFEIREPPQQTISGVSKVCGDNKTIYNYASSVPATASDDFFWDVLSGNGTVVGGITGKPTVSVVWTNGTPTGTVDTLRLMQIRQGCTTVADYPVRVFTAPKPVIVGSYKTCPGEVTTYRIKQPGGGYKWSVTKGSIIGNADADSVHVQWGNESGILSIRQTLNDCADTSSVFIWVETLPKLTIAGLGTTYCISDTLPVKLTPVFDGKDSLPPPADYLANGRFEIRRVSGNKPPTPFLNLGTQNNLIDGFIPADPMSENKPSDGYHVVTSATNLNAGEYAIRYVYNDPTKSCSNYSQEYKFTVKPLPVLSFTGLVGSYCGNDSPVVLSTFKNGVVTPLLPGFKARNTATGKVTLLNGTLFDPAAFEAGNYELFLAYNGGSSECPNTSERDTTVLFQIISPPKNIHILASRNFNSDMLVFTAVADSDGATSYEWNFGNLLANTGKVKYPVLPDAKGSIANINYTLKVTNAKGCKTTLNNAFNIDFEAREHLLGKPTKFTDKSLVLNQSIVVWQWDFGDGTANSSLRHPTHTYKQPGTYWVSLTISTQPDDAGNQASYTLRRRLDIFPEFVITPKQPYLETFTGNSGGWLTHGIVDSTGTTLDRSSWQLKNNAWVTDNGTGDNASAQYYALEQSYVESPCFDITALDRPMVSLNYQIDVDSGADGAVLLYTLDDGGTWHRVGSLGGGINWYDSKPILGKPGHRFTTDNDDAQGWSGKQTNWQTAQFSLDELLKKAMGSTEVKVRFRIAFGSNADNPPGNKFKGFTFDNFQINNRNRQVLLEYFINESLPEAVALDKQGQEFARTNPEAISLHYHTGFPGKDSFNETNDKDPSAKAFFYGIGQVPRLVVDGQINGDSLPDFNKVQHKYSERTLTPAPFNIAIAPPVIESNGSFSFSSKITALTAFDRPVVIHFAVIDTLTRSTATNEEYYHVVRKMLPDAAGTFVKKHWQPSDTLNLPLSWKYKDYPIKLDLAALKVVAFIQDYATKEIFQAAITTSSPDKKETDNNQVTGIQNTGGVSDNSLYLFPNPGANHISIQLPDYLGIRHHLVYWKIKTITGSKAAQGKQRAVKGKLYLNINTLPEGTYVISLRTTKGQRFSKRFQKASNR